MDVWGIRVLFQAGERDFCVLRNVQTGPGALSSSYIMATGGAFPRIKVVGP
jgi:hypothetical protein